MRIVDIGTGTPVVLVPGIQGRWEWMKPAVDRLARECRVITFSLADEAPGGGRFKEETGFACYIDQVAEALDTAGLRQAVICGVSYGGLIAAAFAARHPERVSALVLVSAVSPWWQTNPRAKFFLRAPRLLFPVFCANASRNYREIAAAVPGPINAFVATVSYGFLAITHMLSPSRTARRVRMLEAFCQSLRGSGFLSEIERLKVPTLVVTGEPHLDLVVAVKETREYLRIWPHAREAVIARTGHLGLVTRPDEFVRILIPFVQGAHQGEMQRRHVV